MELIKPTQIKGIIEKDLNTKVTESDGMFAFSIRSGITPVATLMRIEQTLTSLYRFGLKIENVEFRYHISPKTRDAYTYTVKLLKEKVA